MVKRLIHIYFNIQFLKNLFSGGAAFLVDIFLLYFLTGILHWPYLISVGAAFLISAAVNFCLQKFWVFSETSAGFTHEQARRFLLVSASNFVINYVSVFILVQGFNLWYLGVQVVVMGFLCLANFFTYKNFIFNKKRHSAE